MILRTNAVKALFRHAVSLTVLVTTAVVSGAPFPALAQSASRSPNATVKGDLAELHGIPARVDRASCSDSRCRFSITPLTLTLSTPGYSGIRVVLDRVIDTRSILRANSDSRTSRNSHPIMLRGSVVVRHGDTDGGTLVTSAAATILRDSDPAILEVAFPTRPHARRSSQGLIVIRAPLTNSPENNRLRGRAVHASSFMFKDRQCKEPAKRSSQSATQLKSLRKPVTMKATYNVIYVGTDFDPQFKSAMRCASADECNNKIVSIINQTAAYYERQFGYSLEVARQYGPTTYTSSTDSSRNLNAFTNYNNTYRGDIVHTGTSSQPSQVDIFQLFTGKSLDDDIIGLAFLGVTCTNTASDASDMLVQHIASSFDPIITAHETGHTLNAAHTNSGIMSPSLGDPLPSSFNAMSRTEIGSYLSLNYGECRGGTSDGSSPGSGSPGTSPTPSGAPRDSAPKSLGFTVKKQNRDTYIFKTTVSSLESDCSVKIRAATSSERASRGTIVTEFTPTNLTTRLKGRVSASISRANSSSSLIYLYAEYSCANGATVEISKTLVASPNSGQRASRQVSTNEWIKMLNKAF